MPIVGLTGGFGSGKSFVAGLFKRKGAKLIDADRLAHKTLKKGSATYKKIVAAFGKSILDRAGSIDRRKLGKIVFDDRKRLKKLNSIVHPVVIRKIKERAASSGSDVLVLDAPLICETNLSGLMNVMIVVKSSREKQIDRCVKKFNMKEADVCKRMACQMPLKSKMSKADYIVDNNGTRKETEKQVIKIWQELKKGVKAWR